MSCRTASFLPMAHSTQSVPHAQIGTDEKIYTARESHALNKKIVLSRRKVWLSLMAAPAIMGLLAGLAGLVAGPLWWVICAVAGSLAGVSIPKGYMRLRGVTIFVAVLIGIKELSIHTMLEPTWPRWFHDVDWILGGGLFLFAFLYALSIERRRAA